MRRCRTHKRDFGWTCPVCEEEWNYLSRTYLLDAFRKGVRGEQFQSTDIQQQAAYEHGKTFKSTVSEAPKIRYYKRAFSVKPSKPLNPFDALATRS